MLCMFSLIIEFLAVDEVRYHRYDTYRIGVGVSVETSLDLQFPNYSILYTSYREWFGLVYSNLLDQLQALPQHHCSNTLVGVKAVRDCVHCNFTALYNYCMYSIVVVIITTVLQ